MAKDSPRRTTKGKPTAESDVKIEIEHESKKSKIANSRNSVHHKARKSENRKKSVKSPRKSTKEKSKKLEKNEKSKSSEKEHLEKEKKSRRETLKTVDLDDREFTYEKDDIISEAAQQLLAERDKVNCETKSGNYTVFRRKNYAKLLVKEYQFIHQQMRKVSNKQRRKVKRLLYHYAEKLRTLCC